MAQAEHGRQVHHDTGLLTVGQVVRGCARLFSHQLPAVAHHLQLDRQPVALGAHAGQFGRQPLKLAPQRGHIRIQRGRGPGLALGPAPGLGPVGHRALLVVGEHAALPVSHGRRADTQPTRDLRARRAPGRILHPRPAACVRVHRRMGPPAPFGGQLLDPTGQQLMAWIAQRPHRAPQAPAMREIMRDRHPLLLRCVAFATPVVERFAVVAAGPHP